MGETELEQVDSDELCYVPLAQFERLRREPLEPPQRAAIFAALCRINTLYMIARAGSGHIGTSFSSLDIMSWLFLHELKNLDQGKDVADIFFSSKGHDAPALYSVLMASGLLDFELIHRLRTLNGLPGHPHVETPFVQANTGSLGMGISKAKGMVFANRLKGLRDRRVYVLTGDGELQEGQFWESLPTAVHSRMHEITVIVDRNKIQSDTWVARVNDLGDLPAKLRAFGWHVEHCDGHDPAALGAAFARLRQHVGGPQALIADTLKGKGVSFMEGPAMAPGALYGYHSGAPKEEQYAQGVAELIQTARHLMQTAGLDGPELERTARPPKRILGTVERLLNAYGAALVTEAERNPRIVVLDADLVKDCGLLPFQERFPERFIECGIAEQDMVSQAAGLALQGQLPICHSFACFLAARPNEQIYNAATEGRKVIYVASLAGLLPGGPGHSHQSVRDISALAAVPNLVMVEPCSESETADLLDFCLNRTRESSYIRLVSVGWALPFSLPKDYRVSEGRGVVVREGRDAVLFAYGPWLLANAYAAAEQLEARDGSSVKVVNLPWLNRVDVGWLKDIVGASPFVVTLDNHYLHGGQGELLAARIAETFDRAPRVTRIGVTSIPACGGNDEVLRHHRLDADSLAEQLAAVLLREPALTDLA
jgi:transketolase